MWAGVGWGQRAGQVRVSTWAVKAVKALCSFGAVRRQEQTAVPAHLPHQPPSPARILPQQMRPAPPSVNQPASHRPAHHDQIADNCDHLAGHAGAGRGAQSAIKGGNDHVGTISCQHQAHRHHSLRQAVGRGSGRGAVGGWVTRQGNQRCHLKRRLGAPPQACCACNVGSRAHQEELLGEVEALHPAALCHAEQHEQEELKPDGPPDPGRGVGGVCNAGGGGRGGIGWSSGRAAAAVMALPFIDTKF